MRKIEPKMIDFIDQKLRENGSAIDAMLRGDARSLMIYAAEACVGIREQGGNNQGPMVELIQETVGSHSGEAWCMSFVMTMIAYAEVRAGVKSPLITTEHCLTLWRETKLEQKVKRSPLPGAIAIWQHGKSTNGHTGFMVEMHKDTFETVEGNTNSGQDGTGEVVRDGGGVYRNLRTKGKIGDMKLLGFIKPF